MSKIRVEETERCFVVSFRYDPAIVEDIKDVPGRKYDPGTKKWRVPLTERKALQRIIAKYENPQVAVEQVSVVEQDISMVYPTCTKGEPWPHQLATLRAIWNKDVALIDAIMGSGKSRIIVDYVLNKPGIRKVLIVCPHAVVAVWRVQFALHGGKPVVFAQLDRGTVEQKMREAQQACAEAKRRNEVAVVVINYEGAWREPFNEWALDAKFDVLVLDEVHRLTAPGGKASRFMQRLAKVTPVRFGLSGTLLRNSPLDAYGVSRAVGSTIYGTRQDTFKHTYALWGGFENRVVIAYINQEDLRQKLDTIRIAVRPEGYVLPEAVHSDIVLTFPEKVRTLYDHIQKDFYAKVGSGEITIANAAVALMRLQAVTSGFLPLMDQDGHTVIEELQTLKQDALSNLLEDLPADEPIVVFCRFRHDLDMIHAAAKNAGRLSSELSGRVKTLPEWQNGKTTILAAQLRAGSVGVDLTRSCRVVYVSLTFSLEEYAQSLARVRRPGQVRTCFYTHLLVENSVDGRIRKALENKKSVIEALMGDED